MKTMFASKGVYEGKIPNVSIKAEGSDQMLRRIKLFTRWLRRIERAEYTVEFTKK